VLVERVESIPFGTFIAHSLSLRRLLCPFRYTT
jgi:hypothetical protein